MWWCRDSGIFCRKAGKVDGQDEQSLSNTGADRCKGAERFSAECIDGKDRDDNRYADGWSLCDPERRLPLKRCVAACGEVSAGKGRMMTREFFEDDSGGYGRADRG